MSILSARWAILSAALLGCTAATPGPRVMATSETDVLRDTQPMRTQVVQVTATPDSVFAALRDVYTSLGIEIKDFNPQNGEIGNKSFMMYYKVAGVPMHEYMGCGTTMTGPGADAYRIDLSLVSYVSRTAPGGPLRVETLLNARADDTGSSKGWLSCITTGALEERVNELLLKRVHG